MDNEIKQISKQVELLSDLLDVPSSASSIASSEAVYASRKPNQMPNEITRWYRSLQRTKDNLINHSTHNTTDNTTLLNAIKSVLNSFPSSTLVLRTKATNPLDPAITAYVDWMNQNIKLVLPLLQNPPNLNEKMPNTMRIVSEFNTNFIQLLEYLVGFYSLIQPNPTKVDLYRKAYNMPFEKFFLLPTLKEDCTEALSYQENQNLYILVDPPACNNRKQLLKWVNVNC